MRIRRLALLVIIPSVFLAPPLRAQQRAGEEAVGEQMRKARHDFDVGEYAEVMKRLGPLIEAGRLESPEARVDAYRLFGLASYYQHSESDAYRAFVELLVLDPDYELDPFFVPPKAIEFFESVKKRIEPQLAPLRQQRRAEKEARRRALEEEAQRRRQEEREEQRRRLATLQPSVERRVVQREFWVSLMPFGIGQLQNGDRSLGYTLATMQVVFGAASAGSALLIEGLRDPNTQKFGQSEYRIATRLEAVKWIGAGLFYALWVGGAIHAAIKFRPETTMQDRLLVSPAPGATASPVMPLPEPGKERATQPSDTTANSTTTPNSIANPTTTTTPSSTTTPATNSKPNPKPDSAANPASTPTQTPPRNP